MHAWHKRVLRRGIVPHLHKVRSLPTRKAAGQAMHATAGSAWQPRNAQTGSADCVSDSIYVCQGGAMVAFDALPPQTATARNSSGTAYCAPRPHSAALARAIAAAFA